VGVHYVPSYPHTEVIAVVTVRHSDCVSLPRSADLDNVCGRRRGHRAGARGLGRSRNGLDDASEAFVKASFAFRWNGGLMALNKGDQYHTREGRLGRSATFLRALRHSVQAVVTLWFMGLNGAAILYPDVQK
jgi:hypothetical protein